MMIKDDFKQSITAQYKPRIDTDKLFAYGDCKLDCLADDLIKFAEKMQLKDRKLWHMIAEQFSGTPDDEDNGWRGEYWGKHMRGACMTYEYTHDEELYDVLEETAKELLTYQDELGRFSTYSIEAEFNGWDMWSRKYVLLGYLHFYEICKNAELKEEIKNALCRHLDYIISKIGEGKKRITETSDIWQGINSSSILEPVVRLYNITGKEEYIEFAKYIVDNGGANDCNIFNLAYENKLAPHEYPVTKAYELMSCFEGLLEYYRVCKEKKWKIACENFAQQVIKHELTIIGSAGCTHELFDNATVRQTYTKYSGLMLETCVTVTWMKLCYQLLCLTGKSVYADCIECSAYNALFGAVNTEGSRCGDKATFDVEFYRDVYNTYADANSDINGGGQTFDSYSPLRADIRGRAVGGFKPMENRTAYCGCCIAIGAAGLALLPKASVMRSRKGYKFLLYMNGKVSTKDATFEIKTDYPKGNTVEITVYPRIGRQMELAFRVPSFHKGLSAEHLNAYYIYVGRHQYFKITKFWEYGEKVTLYLNMNPRIVRGKKNPDDKLSNKHIAVLYGPLVLARDARFGEVGEVLDVKCDSLKLEPADTVDFPHMAEFDVTIGDKTIKMVDYASCGKTWDEKSKFEAWMRIK